MTSITENNISNNNDYIDYGDKLSTALKFLDKNWVFHKKYFTNPKHSVNNRSITKVDFQRVTPMCHNNIKSIQ